MTMNARTPASSSRRQTSTTLRPALQALRQQQASTAGATLADLGPGTSLPADVRAPFEQRLGQDFSSVRVHTGEPAAALAGVFDAKALADGDELVFAPGRFAPGTTGGRELLAHELSHVAQQRQGGGSAAPAEARARSAAGTVAQGGSVAPQALGGADPGVHCDPEDKNKPSVLPPVPNYQLSTLPPLDYLKLQGIAGAHGVRFSDRDSDDLAAEWRRSAAMLRLFGLDQGIHLGPIQFSGPDLLNLGLSKQYQDRLARENPNSWDRMNQQWDQAHPGGFTIPPITLFSKKF
jgi:hypothetical protein